MHELYQSDEEIYAVVSKVPRSKLRGIQKSKRS
jgi:hypothetical protein